MLENPFYLFKHSQEFISPYINYNQKWKLNIDILQHAHALELLRDRLTEGEKALDVGSGSGYLTACMALLVGKSGKAIGIDHIPELVNFSVQNVMNDHPELFKEGNIKLIGM